MQSSKGGETLPKTSSRESINKPQLSSPPNLQGNSLTVLSQEELLQQRVNVNGDGPAAAGTARTDISQVKSQTSVSMIDGKYICLGSGSQHTSEVVECCSDKDRD